MERDELLAEVLTALTGWTVQIAQLNGVIADRMGVTQAELQCLYVLALRGPETPGRLAGFVNLTTGSASRMIDRLVAAGHVRRVPDPGDRRRVLVEPNPESVARVGEFYAPLNGRLAADLADHDDGQLAALLRFARAAAASTDAVIGGVQ